MDFMILNKPFADALRLWEISLSLDESFLFDQWMQSVVYTNNAGSGFVISFHWTLPSTVVSSYQFIANFFT